MKFLGRTRRSLFRETIPTADASLKAIVAVVKTLRRLRQ
jgi:hypothetical protein